MAGRIFIPDCRAPHRLRRLSRKKTRLNFQSLLRSILSQNPLRIADLPEYISVVMLSCANSATEVERKCKQANALRVRGRVIARWARQMAKIYPEANGSASLDEDAVREYEALGDFTPDSLIHNTVAPLTEDEAAPMLRTWERDTHGITPTRADTDAHNEAGTTAAATAEQLATDRPPLDGCDDAEMEVMTAPDMDVAAEVRRSALASLDPDGTWAAGADVDAAADGLGASHDEPTPSRRPVELMTRDEGGPSAWNPYQDALDPDNAQANLAREVLEMERAGACTPPAASVGATDLSGGGTTRHAASTAGGGTAASRREEGLDDSDDEMDDGPRPAGTRPVGRPPAAERQTAPSGPPRFVAAPDVADHLSRPGNYLVCTAAQKADAKPESVDDPNVFVHCHPYSFPNTWREGPRSLQPRDADGYVHRPGSRPGGMSLEAYGRLLMRRMPLKQFGENPVLMFDLFNLIQRKLVNVHAKAQMRMSPDVMEALGNLDHDTFSAVRALFRSDLNGPALQRALEKTTHAARTIFRSYKVCSSKVMGSPESFGAARSALSSVWTAFGPWTCFVNLNPSELNSAIVFELAGRKYGFELETSPCPERHAAGSPDKDRPPLAERYRIIANNPIACAEFFKLFIMSFVQVFYAWDFRTGEQNPEAARSCPFGKVAAWYFKYEAAERGGSHAHGQVLMPHMTHDLLETALKKPEFKAKILGFMETIMCQQLPAPFWSDRAYPATAASEEEGKAQQEAAPLDKVAKAELLAEKYVQYANLDRDTLTEAAKTQLDAHNAEVQKGSAVKSDFAAHQVPLQQLEHEKADRPAFHRRLCQWVALCVNALLDHHHGETCKKGGHAGGDCDCRMGYPRLLKWFSVVEESPPYVYVKRCASYVVPYLRSLMLAMPINQAMYLSCEQSRWLAQYARWKDAKDAGTTSEGPPPAGSLMEAVYDAVFYAFKYAMKAPQSQRNAKVLSQAVEMLQRRKADELAVPERGKRRLAQMLNEVHKTITYTSVLVGLYVLREGDYICSHESVKFAHKEHERRQAGVDAADCVYSPVEAADGSLVFCSQGQDYKHRVAEEDPDPELEVLPPCIYYMYFHRLKGKCAASRRAGAARRHAFGPEHPLCESHVFVRREKPLLPQLIGKLLPRPDPDATAEDKEAYAAYALGAFVSDRLPRAFWLPHLPPGTSADEPLSLWTELEAVQEWSKRYASYEASLGGAAVADNARFEAGSQAAAREGDSRSEADVVVDDGRERAANERSFDAEEARWARVHRHSLRMLHNTDTLASCQVRGTQRARMRRQQLADGLKLGQNAGRFCAQHMGEDDDDDHDDEFVAPPFYEHVEEGMAEPRLQAELDIDADRLNEPDQKDDYTLASLRPFEDSLRPVAGAAVYGPDVARAGTAKDVLSRAKKAANSYVRKTLTPSSEKTKCIGVRRGPDGRVTDARVDLCEPAPPAEPTDARPATLSAGVVPSTPLKLGDLPPYLPVAGGTPPSVQDTIDLFTLSSDQAVVFDLLASLLLEEKAGRKQPQRRVVLSGQPGSGKSQVLHALLWFAYQHDCSSLIAVVSYTWRAALHVTTATHTGLSTSNFYGVCCKYPSGPQKPAQYGKVQEYLRGKRLIFHDEYSFIDQAHLAACSQSATRCGAAMQPPMCAPDELFAGAHVVFAGDPLQHTPVGRGPKPLYDGVAKYMEQQAHHARRAEAGAAAAAADPELDSSGPKPPGAATPASAATVSAREATQLRRQQARAEAKADNTPGKADARRLTGADIWRSCTDVFILTQQHRANQDCEAGRKLFQYASVFSRSSSWEEVAAVCDALNEKVITDEQLRALDNPHVVLLRNEARVRVNRSLVFLRAGKLNKRVYVWRSSDSDAGVPLAPIRAGIAASFNPMPSNRDGKAGKMQPKLINAQGFFFEGMEYLFGDTCQDQIGVGHCKNNRCVAKAIELDPREPPDDPSKPCRRAATWELEARRRSSIPPRRHALTTPPP
jgi:hypothetical protein